ncbi:hypothetical protein C2G38_2071779 [Gigaspora rosea]|uniref:Secreted protein n=1 Tax=Gigaspora rosea TaxID=44941 RepID=A0A397VS11_9GLOM|nr:hypothetical protein C2G38_2071779 [Gigaspora rosea]
MLPFFCLLSSFFSSSIATSLVLIAATKLLSASIASLSTSYLDITNFLAHSLISFSRAASPLHCFFIHSDDFS